MQGQLADLIGRHAKIGRIDWIGTRPARKTEMVTRDKVMVSETGLNGDHARPGKRAVTLLQAEHLPVITALASCEKVTPDLLRRNLIVSGINLTALRNHPVQIGEAVVQITTPCAPCSRMEEALGFGGYNAMRGHGGWCAQVLTPGEIVVGSAVKRRV